MNDDIAMIPVGHRHTFWVAVIGKFILQTGQLSANESLRVLEMLHRLADDDFRGGYFTKETLAMIEPASRTEYEIFDAARKLDDSAKPDPGGEASFRVLTSNETFGILLKLNPSVAKVIRHAEAKKAVDAVKHLGANGAPITAAPADTWREPRPDPYGHHISEDWVRRPQGPRYAKGSASHPAGEFNVFTG
ncbi:MAG TPA: hypothetical protein VHT02_08670 [Methylocella sp.]|nr:hypothetical protein [Methylocella sp.]